MPCFVREVELLLEGRIQLLLENKDIGIQTWHIVNKCMHNQIKPANVTCMRSILSVGRSVSQC